MMPQLKRYTPDQVETIRQLHARGLNDRAIVEQTGLGRWVVWNIRRNVLQLSASHARAKLRSDSKTHPHREEIARLHELKHSDSAIAKAIGISRECVRDYRRRHLQLRALPLKEQHGRELAGRHQDQTLGRSLGELRAEQIWSFSPSLGWPEGLRKRSAQILELLFHRGPMTSPQIVEALGLKTKKRIPLHSNDPQGTHTGNLIARGLIAAASNAVSVSGRGKRLSLYFITPAAREMKQAWLARRDGHAEQSSTATEERLS